jgi:catechol-2,3-dioxygenase
MKIRELTIYSKRLNEQKQFYGKTLGIKVLEESNSSASFIIGDSILKFITRETATPYHIAFTIPAYREDDALTWLKKRVDILTMDGNEIQDFVNWNAKAIYFYDQDKNIVEFIARNNLKNSSSEDFNGNSLVEISEIGIPTTNIKKEFTFLSDKLGLSIYDGTFENFCAIGSERGLLICIDKNAKGWYPLNDEAYSSDFMLKLIVDQREFVLEYSDEILSVH